MRFLLAALAVLSPTAADALALTLARGNSASRSLCRVERECLHVVIRNVLARGAKVALKCQWPAGLETVKCVALGLTD